MKLRHSYWFIRRDEHERITSGMRRNHQSELAELRASTGRIAAEWYRVKVAHPEPPTFQWLITVPLTDHFLYMHGNMDRDRALLAQLVGERVEYELARTKFWNMQRSESRRP